jgi:hypothetical protein
MNAYKPYPKYKSRALPLLPSDAPLGRTICAPTGHPNPAQGLALSLTSTTHPKP